MKKIRVYLSRRALSGSGGFVFLINRGGIMRNKILYGAVTGVVVILVAVFIWQFIPETAHCAPGDVISSFRLDPEQDQMARISQGLAYDGSNILYIDAYDWTGNFKPTIYELTTTGSVVDSWLAPESDPPYHKGLAWDGENAWVSIAGGNGIWKVGSEDPPITTENEFVYGVTYHDGYLYVVEAKDGTVYQIDAETKVWVGSFAAPDVTDDKYFGLATDGTYLYVSTYGRDDLILKYTIGGSYVSSFNAPCNHPLGLTYDGTYLWCVDDETEKFYQFEK
jgi:DNA-binding beta-propeller fold protein YncE